MKKKLAEKISEWLVEHPNPYDQHINEAVYWNMRDLYNLLSKTEDEEIIKVYDKMFKRFQYYY